ncbi:gastrin/cholecystokinin type B receptor [Nematostella vectensis]|uniref:gastrin/cholecystokinin type B receptor n=1 Tax=Nematostella vectensis TaxID=45351 RepID=UPI002076DD47|nr:gastrin/cholecystokinin type B receptor [Nematostella vectensis]
MNTTFLNASSFVDNSTRSSQESLSSRGGKVFAYVFILAIALAGNFFIILAMKREHRRLRALTYLLITSIAVSDLLMAAWSIPERITRIIVNDRWLVSGITGLLLCKAVNYIEKVSITVSALHILALAFHRFIIIYCSKKPHRRSQARKAGFISIALMWLFSIVYWSPILYYGGLLKDGPNVFCKTRSFYPNWKVIYLVFLTLLLVILVLVLILYGAIALRLCRSRPQEERQDEGCNLQREGNLQRPDGCDSREGCLQPMDGCLQPRTAYLQHQDEYDQRREGYLHPRDGGDQPREGLNPEDPYAHVSSSTRRRTATMVAVMVTAYYGCYLTYWSGWILCSFRRVFCDDAFTFISIFLSYASVAVNPLICLIFSRRYRSALSKMLKDRSKHVARP